MWIGWRGARIAGIGSILFVVVLTLYYCIMQARLFGKVNKQTERENSLLQGPAGGSGVALTMNT